MQLHKKIFPWLAGLSGLLLPLPSMAHVGYVEKNVPLSFLNGQDWGFFSNVLAEPFTLVIIIGVLLTMAAVRFVLVRNPGFMHYLKQVKQRAQSYTDLVPWILRLSLGILLIGAGTGSYLLTPLVPGVPGIGMLEIGTGFALLLGLFTVPATLMAAGLYLAAVVFDGYSFGNLEILALAVALLVSGDTRPGVDDVLGIRWGLPRINWREWVPFILRLGVGGAFIFLAIYEKFLNPHAAAAVVANYNLQAAIPVSIGLWVLGSGLVEVLVGLALLFGFNTRAVSVLAFFVLMISFFTFNEAVFSHVSLFGALSVLFILGGGKWSMDKAA